MSRIGKHPVELAQGVSATLADGFISVKGPKGEVRMHVLPKVAIEQDGNVLSFKQLEETVNPTPTSARCVLSWRI